MQNSRRGGDKITKEPVLTGLRHCAGIPADGNMALFSYEKRSLLQIRPKIHLNEEIDTFTQCEAHIRSVPASAEQLKVSEPSGRMELSILSGVKGG